MNVVIILGISKFLKGGSKKITNRSHSYSRLMKGYDVYNSLEGDKFLICSGGFGQAELMKKFLVDKGIPEQLIIEEFNSRTTIENCVYSYYYLNNLSSSSSYNLNSYNSYNEFIIHIVTNDYHIKRSEYIFNFFKYKLKSKVVIIPHSSSILSYIPNYTEEDFNEVEASRIIDIENFEKTPNRLEILKKNELYQ